MEHLNAMGLKIEDFGSERMDLLKKVLNDEIKILSVRNFEKDKFQHLIITLPKKKTLFDRRELIEIEIYPWEKSDITATNRKIDALAHYLFSKISKGGIKRFSLFPVSVLDGKDNNSKKAA